MTDQSILRRYEEALPIALLRTREAVMARFRPLLTKHGLTEQQWRVIRAVQGSNAIDATALSDRCCILMPSLSRMLKALESDGLITRELADNDKRRQTISLTDKGRDLFGKIAPDSEIIYSQIEKEFGKEDVSNLISALQDLRRAVKD